MTPVKASQRAGGAAPEGFLPAVFAGLFGGLLGLALLKFGNPVVLDKYVDAPSDYMQFLIDSWPTRWGFWMLGVVALAGMLVARWKPGLPRWLVSLPLLWLVWEGLAGTQTMDAALTRATLIHFTTCVACFYLGLFCLSRVRQLWPFWVGLLIGFALVIAAGLEQHFGGLAETRRFFEIYNPDPAKVPKELHDRVFSNRIFSTLFYPNTLAGVILVLLPVTLGATWKLLPQFTAGARRGAMVLTGGAALACLYWSGSKGGWLLMLLVGLAGMLFLPFTRKFKLTMVAVVLVLGLAGFGLKYAGFFKKGAASVVARFDYWQAAVKITSNQPVFGSGPGTFAKAYEKVKKPEWEMARMTHNDFLEQASDSGVVGFVLYAAMAAGTLVWTFLHCGLRDDPMKLAAWLGLLGWALHSLMEFHLYIPAMAWPAFTFMGWLVGTGANRSTAAGPTAKLPPK